MIKLTKIIASVCVLIALSACKNTINEPDTASVQAIPKISVQLWSVKNALKNDFNGTLQKIAGMGFDAVEFSSDFGPYKNDPEGLKALLDVLDLEISGAHVMFSTFNEASFDESVKFFKALGVDTLVIAWDKRADDPAKFEGFVSELNLFAKKLAKHNIDFGFHNHHAEFKEYNNSTFWDSIALSTSKDFILQMDVGWVTYAKQDPVEYIQRYPGRTKTTHIKAKLPKGANLEGKRPIIGDDVTDWLSVLKTDIAVGGTKWFVVEQEEYPDGLTPLEAVNLSKQGLDKIIQKL